MNISRILAWFVGLVVIVGLLVGLFYGIYVRPFLRDMMVMKTTHYDSHLTLVTGGGGNSGILESDSLVLVIDTKLKEGAKSFYDTVIKIAGKRPIVIVNTHIHSDHVEGNSMYQGQTIIAGANYNHEQWIKENGKKGLPTQWVKDSLIMQVGDETVTILNLGFNAHTQSDVVVYLRNRKMIFTGDLVLNGSAPGMFQRYNSSSKGYLASFDTMESRFDIKTVVPGHGEVGGREVIDTYRDFFADMYVASLDNEKKSKLLAKYKDWKQIPIFMSADATISYIKGENKK